MTTNGDELSKTMWDRLVAVLTAEMHTGGRLAAVKDIRRSAQLWMGVDPAIGVQHMGYTEGPYAGYKHEIKISFLIVAGASSQATVVNGVVTKIANLDDANANLDAILSDGSGNGLAPVLRDVANDGLHDTSMNPLANQSQITKMNRTWEERMGADASNRIWSYAAYTYVATTYIFV